MRLAVLRERAVFESRVAATAETVRKIAALGPTVVVETGAGLASSISDDEYRSAGAEIASDPEAALAGAEIVLSVQAPEPALRGHIGRGASLIGVSGALSDRSIVSDAAAGGVDLVAIELLPRITRAQSMDVLSSQANLAGYRAVVEATAAFDRGFPMMMTAAGSVPPARVLVLGAGVAGLQAIATARRLGAIVSATDVRPSSKEEIRSLGATFVGVEDEESAAAQTAGGYAREMSEAYKLKQAELMASTVARTDVIICTALLLGRKAPVIVSQEMVRSMRSGSVIVDIASDTGGNCASTVPGEMIVTENGVRVLGWRNWPGRIPVAASSLYARNLLTFLTTFWDKAAGRLAFPAEDPIIAGVLLVRDGAIVSERFRTAA